MTLSKLAEIQLAEIQYALGCSKQKAISYALENLHAFESITDDQIYNWLDTNHAEKFGKWLKENEPSRWKLKLTSGQVQAIEMLQKDKRIFASFNCYIHRATINFLIRHKIAKMDGHYLVLCKPFTQTYQTK